MTSMRVSPRAFRTALGAVLSASVALFMQSGVIASEGNSNYLGILSSTAPTGFTPSPSWYSIAQSQTTLTFNMNVTNLTDGTQAMNLQLNLDHITSYPINGVQTDISDGQPGVISGAIVDGQFNEALSTQAQDPGGTITPVSIAPHATVTLTFTRTLTACGYYQVDVFKQGLANQTGLGGFEIRVLGCGAPAISTNANPTSGFVGTPISDTATVTGGIIPTGTVSFSLFGPGDSKCTTDISDSSFKNIPLSSNMASSPSYVTTQTGAYNWIAKYNGDVNNATVSSACGSEQVVIVPTTPVIQTAPSAGGVVGISIHDSATVSGGFNPTGTVTFALYGPGDTTCTGANLVGGLAGFANVPLSGGSATSPAFATSKAGTYNWVATYNGDVSNNPVTSNCGAEAVIVKSATPSIVTVPNPGSGTVGTVISDGATVSGGFNPTGTVTFALYGPGDPNCTGTNLVGGMSGFANVTLSGGSAASAGFTTAATGTYNWVATYNGDSNNSSVTSACGAEQVVITRPLGNQGCTPGFWKNPKHFALWTGYSPTQLVSTVFSVPATFPDGSKGSTLGGSYLSAALAFQGGSTLNGAAQILLRASVAGLLNSTSSGVAYSMTTAQIISSVNAALNSGDRNTMLNLATQIDNANNGLGGCPLS